MSLEAPAAPAAPEASAAPEDSAPPASRMAVAVLSLVGVFISGYLTLYKLGYLGVIQCGTGGCETVQASKYAYFLGVPVAVWGIGAYGALLLLALAGVQPRWVRSRGVAAGLFAMAAAGVAFSAYLTYLEAAVIHAWCRWCVASAVLITLIFLLSLPGLRQAR
ncbi:MAG TPA: vitamin K epoxide reductase family protein [Longimicrobiaceae bacterium]|nr:vitamin K epoxide reductase family protein [Longimicrobiaceae bacterium]